MNRIVKTISLAILSLVCSAAIAEETLKIATVAPAGTTWMTVMQAGAGEVAKRTGGRVKLKFYPGGVMGNDQSVHRKIKIGQLHGGAFTPGGLAQVHTAIQTLGLPMLFDTLAEVDYVRERMDPVIMRAMEESGFVLLGISEGGFVRILSKKPMLDLESIRASKVWIPEGDKLGRIAFKALGITPVSLAIADVYTGLQTGLIDTVTANHTSAIAFQWHTSTAYMTEAPVSYVIGVLAIQKKAFDKLAPEDQIILREVMGKAFVQMDRLNRSDNEEARVALVQQGISFVEPKPGELERWKSIADQSIQDMVVSGLISAEIVGQVKSLLQSFRQNQ